MRTKQHLIFVLFLLLSGVRIYGQQKSFAIVIDPTTYKEVRTEVDMYAESIEKEGLKVITLVDKWGVPDSIRKKLHELYLQKETPIEGAVFIGDIPIAMIRDACVFR